MNTVDLDLGLLINERGRPIYAAAVDEIAQYAGFTCAEKLIESHRLLDKNHKDNVLIESGMLANSIAFIGSYNITEEVNCYLLTKTSGDNFKVIDAFMFKDIGKKKAAQLAFDRMKSEAGE